MHILAFSYIATHFGFKLGVFGIQAIPGPQLPHIDLLKRLNDLNLNYYVLQHFGIL